MNSSLGYAFSTTGRSCTRWPATRSTRGRIITDRIALDDVAEAGFDEADQQQGISTSRILGTRQPLR